MRSGTNTDPACAFDLGSSIGHQRHHTRWTAVYDDPGSGLQWRTVVRFLKHLLRHVHGKFLYHLMSRLIHISDYAIPLREKHTQHHKQFRVAIWLSLLVSSVPHSRHKHRLSFISTRFNAILPAWIITLYKQKMCNLLHFIIRN